MYLMVNSRICKCLFNLVCCRQEATHPTALPAGVSHEEAVDCAHAQTSPVLAARVLVVAT